MATPRRVFIFKGERHYDPDPSLSLDEVKALLAMTNPEILNAVWKDLKGVETPTHTEYYLEVTMGRKG